MINVILNLEQFSIIFFLMLLQFTLKMFLIATQIVKQFFKYLNKTLKQRLGAKAFIADFELVFLHLKIVSKLRF